MNASSQHLYAVDEQVLVLFPLPDDDVDDRTTWHWLNAVVLAVTEDYRSGVEYQLVIEDGRVAEYDATSSDPDEPLFPVAFRDASEVQPRRTS